MSKNKVTALIMKGKKPKPTRTTQFNLGQSGTLSYDSRISVKKGNNFP